MEIIFPWSKIIVNKKTAMIYLASFPSTKEPQHHNGYFFRQIEPITFFFFDIPFLWKASGHVWMPKDESEFDVICWDEYEDLRREILPCKKCLWFFTTPQKGYCYREDGEELITEEYSSCSNWENR